MQPATASVPHTIATPPTPAATILLAGLAAGAIDLTYAFSFYGWLGVPPTRIAQHIASGLLGRASFDGGTATALLGVVLHFAMTWIMAAIYAAASRRIALLERHAVAVGLIYGALIYATMNLVVVPLSAATQGTPTVASVLSGLAIHMLGVGLPIALIVRRGRRH